ncbi:uncharacterized protein ACO6RY_17163 [Pungitius sinensis]
MATCVLPRQLLFGALCCWNVLCFPAQNGWSQHGPYEGSFTNKEVGPYPSSRSRPPAVAYVVRSGPGATTSRLTVDMSSEASWRAPPIWDPLEGSATLSGRSQPAPNVAPPLFLQAGELDRDVAISEQTEWPIFPAPPPQRPSSPGSPTGESSLYASDLEPGMGEWETEERMPLPPYASPPLGVEVSAASSTLTASPAVPLELPAGGRGHRDLF